MPPRPKANAPDNAALLSHLVVVLGIVAAAGLLSSYYVASVGAIVWRGLVEIRRKAAG